MENRKQNLRKMVILAMLSAIAYLLVVMIQIPVVLFLKYEPKDVAVTIGGFLFGPLSALVISLVVCLVEMVTVSGTGWIGCLMNFISTCAFACTAALVYKKRHNISGAILGLLAGAVAMIGVMLLWNWLITPVYLKVQREAVEKMLLPYFLPFNALKAGLNSAIILCLYKPLTTALRKARLLPPQDRKKTNNLFSLYIFAAVLLITCVMFVLALQGRI